MRMSTEDNIFCFLRIDGIPDKFNYCGIIVNFFSDDLPHSPLHHSEDQIMFNSAKCGSFKFCYALSTLSWNYDITVFMSKTERLSLKGTINFGDCIANYGKGLPTTKSLAKDDFQGMIFLTFSDTSFAYPTALSYADTSHISNDFIPIARAVPILAPGSVLANVKKYPPRVSIAIDFTGSNRDPWDQGSLHYHNPSDPNASEKNKYVHAIANFSDIFTKLSSNVPAVFGFGYEQDGSRISSDHSNYTVDLVQKFYTSKGKSTDTGSGFVLNCYGEVINQLIAKTASLSGPTHYSSIINHMRRLCFDSNHEIFIIFTDGQPNDKVLFVKSVKELQKNVSVIVIHVNGEFTAADSLMYNQHKNVLTCGTTELNDGSIYRTVLLWIETRIGIIAVL